MSATLVWASSGNAPRTGATNANFLDNLETLVNTYSADPDFFWEVAGKESVTTPLYLLLRRKDASDGRIALIIWSSAPANNNPAILDVSPSTDTIYIAWFPAGNASTLSNLDAVSGTVSGDDTDCVKVSVFGASGSVYQNPYLQYYFDCAEGMLFASGNPASASQLFLCGAGDLIVDAADVAYGCTIGYVANAAGFGTNSNPMPWTGTFVSAGSLFSGAAVRTNYGSANRVYFHAWTPSGVQFNQGIGATDILTQTSAPTKATAAGVQLLGQTKFEGFVLKFRQFGYGPGTTSAFTVYNITGPIVHMRQVCNVIAGVNGYPWVTNFKL